MDSLIKEKLLASRSVAKEQAILMASSSSSEQLHEHLHAYVRAKYLLDPCEEEDNLDNLTDMSISKALKIDRSLLHDVDIAAECTGSTSRMRKKVLLIMSIQKDLKCELDAALTAQADTLTDLAQLIFTTIHSKE